MTGKAQTVQRTTTTQQPPLSKQASTGQLLGAQGLGLAQTLTGQGGGTLLQMQGTVGNQATAQALQQANAGSAPSSSSGAPAQEKPARLNSWTGAFMRDYKEDTSTPGQTAYEVQEQTKKGSKIGHRNEFYDLGIDDSTGEWRMIRSGQEKGFLRKSKISYKSMAGLHEGLASEKKKHGAQQISQIGNPPKEDDEEGPMDHAAEGVELLMTGPEGVMDVLDEKIDALDGIEDKADEKESLERENATVGVASSAGTLAGAGLEGLIGLRKIIKSAKSTDKETDEKAFDITEGVLDTASGTSGFVEGVSGLVNDIGTLKGAELSKAEAVSDWSGSVGEAIGAIKSAFFAVKDIYELVKKALSDEGASLDETVEGGLSAVHNLLEAAKSGVETVKSILEILKMGTGELSKVIPGLGIAVSGISITVKVYNMIKASISQREMTTIKRDFKSKYLEKHKAEHGDSYKEKSYVKENNYSIGGFSLRSSTGTDKEKLADRVNELSAKQDRTPDEDAELKDIQEYQLAKEMKYINSKRLTRGTIQVGLEMTNIAGEIATLSGVGAQVGIPLKAAASGVGVSMSIARKVKQYGRDRASQQGAWGITKSIFNAEKSSDKKQAKRIEHANMILEMIEQLPEYSLDDKVQKEYRQVERYLAATGTSIRELHRKNGDVSEQRKLIVENMAKRE